MFGTGEETGCIGANHLPDLIVSNHPPTETRAIFYTCVKRSDHSKSLACRVSNDKCCVQCTLPLGFQLAGQPHHERRRALHSKLLLYVEAVPAAVETMQPHCCRTNKRELEIAPCICLSQRSGQGREALAAFRTPHLTRASRPLGDTEHCTVRLAESLAVSTAAAAECIQLLRPMQA